MRAGTFANSRRSDAHGPASARARLRWPPARLAAGLHRRAHGLGDHVVGLIDEKERAFGFELAHVDVQAAAHEIERACIRLDRIRDEPRGKLTRGFVETTPTRSGEQVRVTWPG